MYNTGASVLGVLLARAAGEPFGEVLRTRLFEPLGMRDTGFWTPDTDRLATAYRPTEDGLEAWDEPEVTGAGRPAFQTARPGWSPPPTTCWRSPACCWAAGSQCCLQRRSPR